MTRRLAFLNAESLREAMPPWERPALLGTIGGYHVEVAMHEVDLLDGSLHALHFVVDPADYRPRSRHLRAVTWHRITTIFDLRRIAPGLGDDLPAYLERDHAGLIKYTLRPRFPTAAALRSAVCTSEGQVIYGVLPNALETPA